MEAKEVSFEQTVAEAKEILTMLAKPDISLHESVALYKEGKDKIAFALGLLENAKLEVEHLDSQGE